MIKYMISLSILINGIITLAQTEKIMPHIDNNKYWQELAKKGLVKLNPEKKVPRATYRSTMIKSNIAMDFYSPDIEVSGNTEYFQSENSIFISPVDIQVLNSNNSTKNPHEDYSNKVTSNVSENYGQNWQFNYNVNHRCDPATAINNKGRLFINYMGVAGQGISYSDDNGTSWSHVNISTSGTDKNHLWVDNSYTSLYEGNLYCAWMRTIAPNKDKIVISRSTNDGINWSPETVISDGCKAQHHNQGVNISCGPNGNVYAVWAIYDSFGPTLADFAESAIGFTRSTNGGQSFESSRRMIDNIRGIRNNNKDHTTNVTGKDMRVNSFPSMAVDVSNGAYNGNIYVVWSNYGYPGINTGGNIDIYMIRSSNEGVTWTSPIKVNQDNGSNVQYFPWISCDPITGDLAVIFYDDRNVGGDQVEVFVAMSDDAGSTWNDFRVSDIAFTPVPIPNMAEGYMGDYLGISSRNGVVYPVWTDNRSGMAQTYVSPFVLGCIEHITLSNDAVWLGEEKNYQASNTITLAHSGNYMVDGDGNYNGGQLHVAANRKITFKKGFTAKRGSKVHATLDYCTPENRNNNGYNKNRQDNNTTNPREPVQNYTENESFVHIIPNPNNGMFHVQLNNEITNENNDVTLILSDLLGKVYYNQKVNNRTLQEINISHANSGVYLLHVISGGNIIETRKVLKE